MPYLFQNNGVLSLVLLHPLFLRGGGIFEKHQKRKLYIEEKAIQKRGQGIPEDQRVKKWGPIDQNIYKVASTKELEIEH